MWMKQEQWQRWEKRSRQSLFWVNLSLHPGFMDLYSRCLSARTAGFHGPLPQMQVGLDSDFLSALLSFNMGILWLSINDTIKSLYARDRSFGGFLIEIWPSNQLYSKHGPFDSSPPVLCLSSRESVPGLLRTYVPPASFTLSSYPPSVVWMGISLSVRIPFHCSPFLI